MKQSLAILSVFTVLLCFSLVKAQQNQNIEPIITWEAKTFVPSYYTGRAFANYTSEISASLVLVDRGAVSNLTNYEIRWFVDGKKLSSGNGVTTVKMNAPSSLQTKTELKAEIRNYKGQNITTSVIIPLKNPEVVISAPIRGDYIFPDVEYMVTAQPFFFSLSSLSSFIFNWRVDNKASEGDALNQTLNFNISGAPPGYKAIIGAGVTTKTTSESATAQKELITL